jgi:hypothetical protein
MSLNRYHNSRNSDNVFKLLHQENSYLDILKGNVKMLHQDEIGEDEKAIGPHDSVRQTLLQEEAGVDAIEDSEVDEKATPEKEEKAAEEAGKKAKEVDAEMGVKEDVDELIKKELKEISIAVARQSAARAAKHKALATRGMLRGKEPLKKALPKKRSPVGLGR